MKYSFAKELITPDWPTRMSGFASRTSKSVGSTMTYTLEHL